MQLDKQQALAVGDVLLDKAEKSLARTKKMVVESEQMGISTLQKMETQNEQMDKIYEDFDEIDGTLARSKRILGHIAQSAVNDRCIQVLTLLVFIAVVVVLVQSSTKDSSSRRLLRHIIHEVVRGP
jgi:SNARE protein